MSTDPRDDRDVVVVDRRGSGLGTLVGIVLIVLLLVGVWYFAFGPGQGTFGGSQNGTDINVNVDLPSVAPGAS